MKKNKLQEVSILLNNALNLNTTEQSLTSFFTYHKISRVGKSAQELADLFIAYRKEFETTLRIYVVNGTLNISPLNSNTCYVVSSNHAIDVNKFITIAGNIAEAHRKNRLTIIDYSKE